MRSHEGTSSERARSALHTPPQMLFTTSGCPTWVVLHSRVVPLGLSSREQDSRCPLRLGRKQEWCRVTRRRSAAARCVSAFLRDVLSLRRSLRYIQYGFTETSASSEFWSICSERRATSTTLLTARIRFAACLSSFTQDLLEHDQPLCVLLVLASSHGPETLLNFHGV